MALEGIENPAAELSNDARAQSIIISTPNAENAQIALTPMSFQLARVLMPSQIIAQLWQILPVANGLCFPLFRLLDGGSATELQWAGQIGTGLCIVLMSAATLGLWRAVTAGGLEKLGLDSAAGVQMGMAGRKTLSRWKVGLSFVVFLYCLFGLGCLTSFFMVGKKSKLTGRTLTPAYVYTVGGSSAASFLLWWPLIHANWIYALQYGSVLAGESVDRVTSAVLKLSPTDPEWQIDVVAGIKSLVQVTLPVLSDTFGNSLAFVTLGCWTGSLASFAAYLVR